MRRCLRNDTLVIAGRAHAVQLASVALDDRYPARLCQRDDIAHACALCHEYFIAILTGSQKLGHRVAALEQIIIFVRFPIGTEFFSIRIVHLKFS